MTRLPDGEQRLIPIAHRGFRGDGPLYCQYDIHGAAQASISYSLQTWTGRAVSVTPPVPVSMAANGRSVGLLALSLAGLEAGPYELLLEAQDGYSGARMIAREPFILERAAEPSP